MSTTTAPSGRRSANPGKVPGLTYLRAVKSEWIKLTSLRSSIIILILIVLTMVVIALMSAWGVTFMADDYIKAAGGPDGSDVLLHQVGPMARTVPASGIAVAQIFVGSLAVIQIGSEYGTRMISTTLTAVPRRITAVLAKTLVIAGTAFIVGVASAFLSYLVVQPILEPYGLAFDITADGGLQSIVSAGTYLALIAVLGLGLGGLLRNSAGGIMTTLGLMLVLPVVATILAGQNKAIADISRYLPSQAGIQMVATHTEADALTQLQGALVVLAWAAVALAAALMTVKRRDA